MAEFNAAFWNWFGDSKVVDSQGKPLVVYHGSDAAIRFSMFTKESATLGMTRPLTMMSYGFWFTDYKEAAVSYSKRGEEDGSGGYLYEVYLSIQNPLDLRIPDAPTESVWSLIERLRIGMDEANYAIKYMRRDPELHGAPWENVSALSSFIFLVANFRAGERDGPEVIYGGYQEAMRARYKKYQQMALHRQWLLAEAGFDGVFHPAEHGADPKYSTYVALYPEQIKSATGNDGTWDIDDPDITSNPPRYTPKQHPETRRWFMFGYTGDGYWIQITKGVGFATKTEVLRAIKYQMAADRDAEGLIPGALTPGYTGYEE